MVLRPKAKTHVRFSLDPTWLSSEERFKDSSTPTRRTVADKSERLDFNLTLKIGRRPENNINLMNPIGK
jgi:hypothetical protein